MRSGLLSIGPMGPMPAALLLLLADAVGALVPVGVVPDPEPAVPLPPAVCDPAPLRPGPGPAPLVKYYSKVSGPFVSSPRRLWIAYSFGPVRNGR